MSTTTQRRLKPIQDHIDNGNWKQALQLCEKYQKKGEKSEAFLATRAFVLANQLDEKQQKQGKDALLQLCDQTPPITDEDTILQLDTALTDLNLGRDRSVKLWERAASARAGDKELLEKWLARAVSEQYWLSAQKAAMMLRKHFPTERQYEFWVIFMCYRIHKDVNNDGRTRTLFGTMAYKMLAKAASETPVVTEQQAEISSGKAIHTPDELALLVSVYNDLGYCKEALSLLQSENLGIQSRVAKLDPLVFRDLVLVTLQNSDSHEDVARLCHLLIGLGDQKALDRSQTISIPYAQNSRMWSVLVDATLECNRPEAAENLQRLIENYRMEYPMSRHAYKAYLQLLTKRVERRQDVGDALLVTCKDIFSSNYDKPTAVSGIRNAAICLDEDASADFVMYCKQYHQKAVGATRPWDSFAAANALQLIYMLNLSRTADSAGIYMFALQCLSVAAQWTEEGEEIPQPMVSILLTGIASLVRVATENENSAGATDDSTPKSLWLLYSFLVARFANSRSSPNYEVQLLVLRLSQVLGMSTITLKVAQQLSIKNLQWDTFAHTFLTRVSTIHPQNAYGARSTNETYLSPQSALYSAAVLYQRSEDTSTNAMMQGLHQQAYRNADEVIEFTNKLKDSICRKIYYVESQRVKRLIGSAGGWKEYTVPSADQRLFTFFPNREHPEQRTTEERLRCGPLPKEAWVNLMLACDRCYQLVYEGPSSAVFADENASSAFLSYILDAGSVIDNLFLEATTPERLTAELQLHVGCAAVAFGACKKGYTLKDAHETPRDSAPAAELLLENMIRSLIEELERFDNNEEIRRADGLFVFGNASAKPVCGPQWSYFHHAYSILDGLKFVSQFVAFADAIQKMPTPKSRSGTPSTKASWNPQNRQQILRLANKVQANIHDHARELKMRLSRQGALGQMIEFVMDGAGYPRDDPEGITAKLEQWLATAEIEEALLDMKESWEEGLERLFCTKVVKE